MTTELQRRLVCRNRQVALLAKISIPGYGDILLSSHNEPFAPLNRSVPVNPVIVSVSGLYYSDLSRVSDLSIVVLNKKLNTQPGNQVGSRIKFSDLVSAGLDRATIEIKELIANTKPLEVSSYDAPELITIFCGRIRRPFKYSDDTMTIGATAEDRPLVLEYPLEVIGEKGGTDPRRRKERVPILCGACTAEMVGSANIEGEAIGIFLKPASAPAKIYDRQLGVIAVSSREVVELQHVTVRVGDLPFSPILPSCVRSYTDDDHTDYAGLYRLFMPSTLGGVYFTPLLRCDGDPYRNDHTYTHEHIGREGSQVQMQAGESLAIMTPIISNYGDAEFDGLLRFYIELEMPEGAELKLTWDYAERKYGGWTASKYYGILRPGDIRGGEGGQPHHILTTKEFSDAFYSYLVGERNIGIETIRLHWSYFASNWGVRLRMKRIDSGTEPVVINGIYALIGAVLSPRFAVVPVPGEGYYMQVESDDWEFGCSGRGIPSTGACSPKEVIGTVLRDVFGIPAERVDTSCGDPLDVTTAWKLGFSIHRAVQGDRLIADLAKQATMRVVKDSDGVYRLRYLARFGAEPSEQRYPTALRYGRDVLEPPVVEPLGDDEVRNVIVIDYQEVASGEYVRTAWVGPEGSDDGYGNRNATLEAISSASVAKYGERRLEIQGWAIRDRTTAVGVRDYYLSRYAEPLTRVRLRAGHIAAGIRVGQFISCDPETMDQVMLFNGESWQDKWFEVEDMRRSGDSYLITAISVPTVDVAPAARAGRRVMVAGG